MVDLRSLFSGHLQVSCKSLCKVVSGSQSRWRHRIIRRAFKNHTQACHRRSRQLISGMSGWNASTSTTLSEIYDPQISLLYTKDPVIFVETWRTEQASPHTGNTQRFHRLHSLLLPLSASSPKQPLDHRLAFSSNTRWDFFS